MGTSVAFLGDSFAAMGLAGGVVNTCSPVVPMSFGPVTLGGHDVMHGSTGPTTTYLKKYFCNSRGCPR